jgi:hypothetical protein
MKRSYENGLTDLILKNSNKQMFSSLKHRNRLKENTCQRSERKSRNAEITAVVFVLLKIFFPEVLC